jgi:ATP-binding cassette subfamily C (CFTR/MRP) protein 1
LVASVVTLARPLIIGHTVTFVTSYTTANPEPLSHGWGLVGATALTYLVYSVAIAVAHIATQRSSLALRGALMEALYRKSMVIRAETAREMGAAKASNLMSVDVNAVVVTVKAIHEVWTALVMTGLGLYLIYTQIGISFVSTHLTEARSTDSSWLVWLERYSSLPCSRSS